MCSRRMAHYGLMVGERSPQGRGKFMLKHSLRVGVAAATLAALSAAFVGGASAANPVQNGDFNFAGGEHRGIIGPRRHVRHRLDEPGRIHWVHPEGTIRRPGLERSAHSGGSAGPGYGVANGLVGPPSGNAQMVIDGTEGFRPHRRLWLHRPDNQRIGFRGNIHPELLAGWKSGNTRFRRRTTQMFTVSLGDQSFNSLDDECPLPGFLSVARGY